MMKDTKDTRQHIVDTGYRLIVSKGFASVGLAEILGAAGVPKGSFYYYFKSKEQFGEEVIKSYFKEYLVWLEEVLRPQTNSAYDRLLNYWQRWIETQSEPACGEQKCLVVKLSAEVSDLSEPMRLALQEGSSKVILRIALCIEEGIADGSITGSNANFTAELLYTMWLGASLLSKLNRHEKPLQRALQATSSLLRGNTLT
ncbi:TetR/AcrR family transcriptional regulator [Desulfopila aestuarii]|uniref:Transcriptional regulator, TetR family n=1 Tax=Desulfopila aestuarii DSM 18488 TaxID=1121416 RepID=A0A1M7YAJ0_9BACT|nr:TetR/AcrR family transcriptional regulator [Desulfopila aestuarii]SHO49652.1 transcriptional regulator, TetR family [Desulfopila aestuarii DSM 18488]